MSTVADKLFARGVMAAKSWLKEEYLSPGGVLRKKRPIDRQRDAARLQEWAMAVWIGNEERFTPTYWNGQLLEAAQKELDG